MKGMTIDQAVSLAEKHHRAGQLTEAEQIYTQIISGIPNHVFALHMIGVIHCQRSQYESGIGFLRRAIAIDPNLADAYCDLGNALTIQGRPLEAIPQLQHAIALKPENSKAFVGLAGALNAA